MNIIHRICQPFKGNSDNVTKYNVYFFKESQREIGLILVIDYNEERQLDKKKIILDSVKQNGIRKITDKKIKNPVSIHLNTIGRVWKCFFSKIVISFLHLMIEFYPCILDVYILYSQQPSVRAIFLSVLCTFITI